MCTSASHRTAVILFAVPVATVRHHPHTLAWQRNLWGRSLRRGMITSSPCDCVVWNACETAVLCSDIYFVFGTDSENTTTGVVRPGLRGLTSLNGSHHCSAMPGFPHNLAMALVLRTEWGENALKRST